MRGYGLISSAKSKKLDLGFEDVYSIQVGGRKSSLGRLPEKCGVYKSYTRNTNKRAYYRRLWKKIYRQLNKININTIEI